MYQNGLIKLGMDTNGIPFPVKFNFGDERFGGEW